MHKSERLNDLMLFLNDKSVFNLKDLMERYRISRSTAIRDVQSLEEMGMPIYSQPGRNGHYGLLQNKLLSPIVFGVDEVFALYFSMLTLRAYESTPFHLSVEKLKKKFENCLSAEKVAMLHQTANVLSLGAIPQKNHCHLLKDILQFTLEEKTCDIQYERNGALHLYTIQFYQISASFGQWYATGYDFNQDSPRVFRCDKIASIKENHVFDSKPLAALLKTADQLFKASDAVDFQVIVSEKGADLFQKEPYPSMKLLFKDGTYMIQGYYNPGEERFIATYFIGFGQHLVSIQPPALKQLMLHRLNELQTFFSMLPS